MSIKEVRYLAFDIESVADGELIAKVRYPGEDYRPEAAVEQYRTEMNEKYGSEFIPYTFQIPVAIAIVKIDKNFRLLDVVTLDEPEFRPHVITSHFWEGWAKYKMPTLISFNGRTFDIPLMELAAFRYGVSVPTWFNVGEKKSWEQRRNRYNQTAHLDLQELLTNFGTTRFAGGLNLVANLLGKPGKMGIVGHMVQDLYHEGQLQRINDYCRCDVLDTYFVFLRSCVLIGDIDLKQERELVAYTHDWLTERSSRIPVYAEYLKQWGDWPNPWSQ
jgi:predicted PolB exonuclease-like 3'-5' exonuclease